MRVDRSALVRVSIQSCEAYVEALVAVCALRKLRELLPLVTLSETGGSSARSETKESAGNCSGCHVRKQQPVPSLRNPMGISSQAGARNAESSPSRPAGLLRR